jgi:hypothetical protein
MNGQKNFRNYSGSIVENEEIKAKPLRARQLSSMLE